jgi:phage gp37-like protein
LAEKNLDQYLETDKAFGKMAIQRVMIKKANSYMDKSGFEWVNDKDLNMNDPKARAKLIKAAEAEKQEMWQRFALVTQLGLDRAKLEGLDEAQTAQKVAQYQENFLDLEEKMAKKAFDMTLDDVSHDRFNAAAKFVDEKVQGMDKKEAKEYRAKFVRTAKDYVKNMDSYQGLADDLATRLEMKTADGQTTDLRSFTQKILQTEATQRAFMEDYQRGLSIIQAGQENNSGRQAELGKFKTGILAPSAKDHMFTEIYTPKKQGGRT